MQEPEPVRLFYFTQDPSGQIWCWLKSEEAGHIRWEVPLWKAADLSAELARMVSVGIRNSSA